MVPELANAIITWEWWNGLLATFSGLLLFALISNILIERAFYPKWLTRPGYGVWELKDWKPLLGWSTAMSVVVGVLIYTLASVNPSVPNGTVAGLLLGVATYFLVLTGMVDYAFHLVPKELTNFALIVSAFLGGGAILTGSRLLESAGADSPLQQTLSVLAVHQGAGALVFLGLLFFPHALGFADIKMSWAVGFFLVWYVGIPIAIVILFLTTLLLFIALVVRKIVNRVKGLSGKVGLPVLPAYGISVVTVCLLAFGGVNLLELFMFGLGGTVEYIEF